MPQLVSVVIVNYNSGDLLARSLKALGKQTLRPKQIYVVDNASRDGSCERIAADFPEVILMPLEQNIGFAAANNLAVRRADGCEWIALLNPDAIPADDWLERLVAAAKRWPDVICFASRMLQQHRTGFLDGAGDAYHVSGLAWRRGHDCPAEGAFLETEEIFSACAAAALYRRDAFEAVGGFDDDFFCYLEDVDLGFRLRLAGYRCLYVPDAVVYHVGSATTGKDSDFSLYHIHRNLVWTYVKNMPGLLLWLYLAQHIFVNAYSVASFAAKHRLRVILKAKVDALRGLSRAWHKRRETQSRRVATLREMWKALDKGFPRRRR